jgi:F-type H+-transporting ATPase subunit gamma
VANLRDIRKRIVAIEKTQKITRAMKMVSAAKLARATNAVVAARPYADTIGRVLAAVAAGIETEAHPLLLQREEVRRLDVAVFTSDRGLCGAFNANIIKRAEQRIVARLPDLEAVSVVAVGRRGFDYFRRRDYAEIGRSWVGISSVTVDVAHEVASHLVERFSSGQTDEVILVYSEFQSALTQRPTDRVLLPVRPRPPQEGEDAGTYEVEPSTEAVLDGLVPQAVEFEVFRAMLESQAGEHGARMTAMENATSNTTELIQTLTLDYNKARQAAITAELVEIVSGAEAL